ncbi:MAG: hypothetical protein KAU50_05645, partial [Candidatus Marinimicrobia bacterium]|nr:hypothetical protein [Candidatus Neomarinimicrobiota bacterium]
MFGCAYFNTFYNAETYYQAGMKEIERTGESDNRQISSKAAQSFALAIEKSIKVIDEYPESRYVDDAFYIT